MNNILKTLIITVLSFVIVSVAYAVQVGGGGHNNGKYALYGEMYTVNNTNATTITAQNSWHSVLNDVSEGETNGFTYDAGSSGEIASIADAGGGDITINDAAHGLVAGDIITVNNTNTYDAIYEVKTKVTDSFTVTASWGDDSTGSWQQGASLTADTGSAGLYRGTWAASGTSETTGHVFEFSPCLNATAATKSLSKRKFSNTDFGAFAGMALMNISDGDTISFIVRNISGSGDVILYTRDMNLIRVD